MIMIKQRTNHDCAICCIAMVSGKPYEEVIQLVGDKFDPHKGLWGIATALERVGFTHRFEKGKAVGDIVTLRRMFCISPEYFLELAWKRRALICVPSLNFKTDHMVYYDGDKVYDPSNLNTYKEFNELKPEELVLFSEYRP